MLSGLVVGLVALSAELGTVSPRHALQTAREAVARQRAAGPAPLGEPAPPT
jgi:hypothetical protein